MKSRQEIKEYAKYAFGAQRNACILGTFLVMLLAVGFAIFGNIPNFVFSMSSLIYGPSIPALGGLLAFSSAIAWLSIPVMLFSFVLSVNLCGFFVRVYYGQKVTATEPYSDVKFNFPRKLGGMCWMILWVYLWSLVGLFSLFIPTIIKVLSYSMTPYILANNPNVQATDAIKLSMRMTQGHKGKIFVMYLSFIGWQMLNGLTFGILGIFYVFPYMNASVAGLFIELRNYAVATGAIHPAELDGYQQQYGQPPMSPYGAPPVQQYPQQPGQPPMPPYGAPPVQQYNEQPSQYPPPPMPPPPQYPTPPGDNNQ